MAICLSCHRSLEFKWTVSPDGGRLAVTAPARMVASERDERNPGTTWVTLQARCRCQSFLGIVVELVEASAPAATAEDDVAAASSTPAAGPAPATVGDPGGAALPVAAKP